MIDAILSWPRNCDYPLWRQFILDERHRFARVLVVFTEHDGPDYRDWISDNLPGVECFDSPDRGKRDWRDVAVNAALDRSDACRVWFTEQDFITSPIYWKAVEATRTPAIGWREWNTDRWHPSSLFVDRVLIEGTTRYFGTPPVDHFYTFGKELDAQTDVSSIGWGFEHLAGLSQNHHLIDTGERDGLYDLSRFRRYLRSCLASDVPLHPDWAERARTEALA